MEAGQEITIELVADEVFSYALFQNGLPLVRSVTIYNDADEFQTNLLLEISTDSGLCETFKQVLQPVPPKEIRYVKEPQLVIHGAPLKTSTEKEQTVISAKLLKGDRVIAADHKSVSVLPYNLWMQNYYYDLLAAFVQPNHPVVIDIMVRASKYMEKISGSSAITGYQCNDPVMVSMQAAAAYAALEELNLTYSNPPASFEYGQRIRMPDEIMHNHIGTCMDITLLYASVIEAMRLNPILVLQNGHIFAGVWLVDKTLENSITYDFSTIEKEVSDGINELILVECTTVCGNNKSNFADACKVARSNLAELAKFEIAVDVKRARLGQVQPISLNIEQITKTDVKHFNLKENEIDITLPEIDNGTTEMDYAAEPSKLTKQDVWERKLLDLSLRNSLISTRYSNTELFLCNSPAKLENILSQGKVITIKDRPNEWQLHNINTTSFEAVTDLGQYEDVIDNDLEKQILHLWDSGDKRLTAIYRNNRTSVEENGASNLFLALGMLRWFERGQKTAHYAPLILYPVELTRRSGTSGYLLKKRDEDTQINISLLEYIRHNFDFSINGVDELPLDDSGIDVKKIFTTVRKEIMQQPGWNVIETCVLGNFSFSQFVMWNDIHSGEDRLKENKIIRNLVSNTESWDVPDDSDNEVPITPIPLDSSQIKAVNYAEKGYSFVLHGPPGTGKSQTITALIANALAKGKTVLFVSEKKAALDVVYSRLKKLGIESFCLELHSNKAVKKNVLDQLNQALEINLWGFSTEYDKELSALQTAGNGLDAYRKALHDRLPFGLSVYELICRYEAEPDCGSFIHYSSSYINSLNVDKLEVQLLSLDKLDRAGKTVGNIKGNECSFIKRTDYSQKFKMDLEDCLYEYSEVLNDIENLIEKCAAAYPEIENLTLSQITEVEKNIADNSSLLDCWPDYERFSADIIEEISRYRGLAYIYNSLAQIWRRDFIISDITPWLIKLGDAGKKLFGKSRALAEITAQLQQFAVCDLNDKNINESISKISEYREKYAAYQQNLTSKPEIVKRELEGCAFSAEKFEARRTFWQERFKTAGIAGTIKAKAGTEGRERELLSDAATFAEKASAGDKLFKKIKEMLEADIRVPADADINYFRNFCEKLRVAVSSLRDWIMYQAARKECIDNGLNETVKAFEEGKDTAQLKNIHERSVYRALIRGAIADNEVLNSFTGFSFNEQILCFKALNEQLMETAKDELYYRLTHRLPLSKESAKIQSELALLRKVIKSGGRNTSLRSLFNQISNVILRLCPCLLMSPISVAQYLPFINNYIDIVVFDEASQLPTNKAVGAIARGRSTVVVGDPNQMPPTSFFSSKGGEENIELDDLDSILDDCLAIGMPSCYLTWHYRSRHESLIAFSNQAFYENKMLTFPSMNDRERKVKLVTVDGRFSRKNGRINDREAKAIVSEIIRRYKNARDYPGSIGVITFNANQQDYIEDILLKEYHNDPGLEKWALDRDEPLFIKNLENVQGDERDTIIFSVCFGQNDEDGGISLNFGPINQSGGWKRLNVAISRAREEMLVFSSMTPDMIDLNKTKSEGVADLHDFLAYAQNGRLGIGYAEEKGHGNGLAGEIIAFLRENGYTCQQNVGHSDFKVDIAVIDPERTGEYILGILLDGENYRKTENTKDREISQTALLKNLNWNIHRMWTMDWWDNKDRELEILLNLLNNLRDSNNIEVKETAAGPVSEPITRETIREKERKPVKKENFEKISSFKDTKRFSNLY